MKLFILSHKLRFSGILILAILCVGALIKTVTTSAQEGKSNAELKSAQEAPAQRDVLEKLIKPDASIKSPSDSIIPSQVEAGANLMVPNIGAQKVDTIFTDVDGDGRADPGDTLQYTITISNTGDDASNMVFTDTIDANTSLVGGSTNTTPIAFNDPGYTAAGNVRISISAANGVLTNDIDPDTGNNTGLTASAGPLSANNGNVVMAANGSFTYDPFPGFTGTDTFTYTVTDAGGATGTGTVTFNVSGMIWFVDDTDPTPGGDGRLSNPFQCLVGAGCYDPVANDEAGDNIFLYSGAYTGGLTLLANQRVIGQGATTALTGAGSITGIIPPSGSDSLPSTGGTNPTITTTAAATSAFTLASGNTFRGVTIGNTTGSKLNAIVSVGTLTVGPTSGTSDVTLNGTGQALNLTSGGTLAARFASISADGGTSGIVLVGLGGNLASPTTNIQNSTGTGIGISNSVTGGTFDLGNTTSNSSAGTGIALSANANNLTFADLDISPDAGQRGLHAATNTGTITTTSGVISAATHTAVEVSGTSAAVRTPIAMVLTTVSSATSAAPNGIILTNTSGTGFSVVGTGSAGSGGTIANKTGANGSTTAGTGIYLNTVTNISLARMQLNNFQNFGIRGFTVNGFTLSNSTVNTTSGLNGNDAGSDEGSVSFDNLTGTVNITNSFIEDALEANCRIINTTGTLTLTVSGSTFRDTSPNVTGLQGLLIQSGVNAGDVANITANITTSTFTNNFARGIMAVHNQGGTMEVNIGTVAASSGGTFDNNFTGVDIAHNSSGTTHFNVKNATFSDDPANVGPHVNLFMGNQSTAGSVFMGRVHGNVITGSNNQCCAGIASVASGAGTMTIAITNNNVSNIAQRGISVAAGQGSNTVNATITGNTVSLTDINSAEAIFATASVNGADTSTMNATIGGAGALQNNLSSVGGAEVRVEARFGRTFILPGYAGGNQNTAQVNTFTASNNNINGGSTSSTVGLAPMGQFLGTPATPTPTNSNARLLPPDGETSYSNALESDSQLISQQWRPSLLASHASTTNKPVAIQANTPSSSETKEMFFSHFRRNASRLAVKAQEDRKPAQDESKKPTTRDIRTTEPIKDASPEDVETVTVNGSGSGFTLPAGKTITVTFRVTIDSGVLPAFTQVSNQGNVSGSNFFAVILTDDPSVGGSADPTVTPIDHTTVAVSSNANPSVFGQNVTFTATMTGVPARASDPPGNVQFKADGNNIGASVPVVIGAAGDNVSTAQASISSLSIGSHVITAEYSGGGAGATGYNANIGTLAVNQVVNKSNTASAITADTPDPSLTGQSVTVTFTVSPAGGGAGTPTGNVTVSDGVDQCTDTAAVGSCTLTLSTAGARTLTATYVGDGNFNASPASPGIAHTVTNTATWVGGTSSDWDTDTNWGTGRKPNLLTHSANIPAAGVTNEPTISVADVQLTDLTVATGRTLTLNLGRILTATGNTTLSGNLAGGGTSNFNNLTINNAAGVAIGGNANVSGVLTLTSGNTTIAGTLAVGGGGSITRTAGHVIGNLKKTFAAPGSFTYHVGTLNGYSPLATTVTAGTGDLTVKANQGTVSPLPAATSLQRYWTLTEAGSLTANLTFNYLQTDVAGNEAIYRIIRVEGGSPVSLPNNCPSPCVNPATNMAVINGVSNFSDWTLGEQVAPTAISADLSGRVTHPNGRPMRWITVSLLNVSTSEVFLTRTNPKGLYKFSEVATGADYIITPFREGYEFNPQSRVINHTGLREDVDFETNLSNKPVPNENDPTRQGGGKQRSNPIPADFVPPAEP